MRKRGLKRTRSFLFLPFLFPRALCVYIYPFPSSARRAMTDFPMTNYSVSNVVQSNDKFNKLFVTYFNIRQRIHRFLEGF